MDKRELLAGLLSGKLSRDEFKKAIYKDRVMICEHNEADPTPDTIVTLTIDCNTEKVPYSKYLSLKDYFGTVIEVLSNIPDLMNKI